MADIDVAKPFKLTLDGHTRIAFKAGPQTVDDEIAAHWYVQAHLVGAKARPAAGSIAALRAEGEAAAKAAQAKVDEEAAFEAELAAEAQAKARADLAAKTSEAIAKQAASAQKAASQPAAGAGK